MHSDAMLCSENNKGDSVMISGSWLESSRSKLQYAIANLPPAYFAMVMATGIVSIASHLLGFRFLDISLLWLNVLFYAILWGLNIVRVLL